MKNYITCPRCNKTISDDPLIDNTAKKEGSSARAITCECGERITFWNYHGPVQREKWMAGDFKNWLKSIFRVEVKARLR